MAKAQEITGLDCSIEATEGAANVLRVRLDEIADFYKTSADFSDVDLIHDLRVATRRLRNALRDFAPLLDKEKFKPLKKELKKFADALGKIRDEDVAIGALEKIQSETENEAIKEVIENLLEKQRNQRETAQAKLSKDYSSEKIDRLRKKLAANLDKTSPPKDTNISFKEFGKTVIERNLREFETMAAALYFPFHSEELHLLRLRAKRLRYALKTFAICWEEECRHFAKKVSKMQTFLGDLHDADEWIQNLLGDWDEENSGKEKREALIQLSAVFLEQRNQNYIAALQLWNQWQAEYFLPRLKAMTL